jgi:hypothetical protein
LADRVGEAGADRQHADGDQDVPGAVQAELGPPVPGSGRSRKPETRPGERRDRLALTGPAGSSRVRLLGRLSRPGGGGSSFDHPARRRVEREPGRRRRRPRTGSPQCATARSRSPSPPRPGPPSSSTARTPPCRAQPSRRRRRGEHRQSGRGVEGHPDATPGMTRPPQPNQPPRPSRPLPQTARHDYRTHVSLTWRAPWRMSQARHPMYRAE